MRRTSPLPLVVRLHFLPARLTPAHDGPTEFTVEARAPDDGELVWTDSIRGMADWLRRHGFAYVAGSQAVWTRPAPTPMPMALVGWMR